MATSHYLNQCWPDSLTHICCTGGWWGKLVTTTHSHIFQNNSYVAYRTPCVWLCFHQLIPLSAIYMRQGIGSALVQTMACRLFGAKSITWTVANTLSNGPLGTNCVVCENSGHFVRGRWVDKHCVYGSFRESKTMLVFSWMVELS